MLLQDLVNAINAELITPGKRADLSITSIYAGDRMSDLLNGVRTEGMLVTHIAHQSLIRLIELMDVPALCLLNDAQPEETVLEIARSHGTAIMVMSQEMYEACGLIYQALEIQKH